MLFLRDWCATYQKGFKDCPVQELEEKMRMDEPVEVCTTEVRFMWWGAAPQSAVEAHFQIHFVKWYLQSFTNDCRILDFLRLASPFEGTHAGYQAQIHPVRL